MFSDPCGPVFHLFSVLLIGKCSSPLRRIEPLPFGSSESQKEITRRKEAGLKVKLVSHHQRSFGVSGSVHRLGPYSEPSSFQS